MLRGIESATKEMLVVMDADGSHPPESIPDMVQAVEDGADFSLGSRYVPGGSTEDGWGVLRWVNSKIATLMARPFTTVRDPMSGFFCLRASTVERGESLDPIGYKIGLELIVKCRCERVAEVPIHFSTRREGESKLTLRVQWEYLLHILNLCRFKYPRLASFIPFALVGLSGIGVYSGLLAVLDLLVGDAFSKSVRIVIAIALSMNLELLGIGGSPSGMPRAGIVRQYLGFVAVCTVPVLVNFFVTLYFSDRLVLPTAGLIGSVIGSAFGLVFNWCGNRWLVFRRS